jgi:pimeloyl-ACP methyl ester carboxylesterase
MPQALSLSSLNSTNVRLAFETLTRRVALRASSALAPGLAGLWAEKLFLTPPRPRHPESAFYDLIDARQHFVTHRGRRIVSWRWGSLEAPAVLLAHGWGGRATQMRRFVFPLAAAGFRVIAYDQPAHGLSEGRLTGLPDFADALAEVARSHGGVHAVIGHSLGATAAALALEQGRLPAPGGREPRVVLVAPPSDILGYSRHFANGYWIPERVRGAMQAAIEERYGVAWSELDVERLAPKLAAPALVIHDRRDRMVPWKQGARFARAWPGARLLVTDGLGHGRILEDDAVTRAAADFVAGRSAVANVARPALPQPAPLY